MSTSMTVLDNTEEGAVTLPSVGHLSIRSLITGAYSFTTDAGSSWQIIGIRLGVSGSTAATYTINLNLYAASGNAPTGSALASVSMSVPLTTAKEYVFFDAAALSSLASYTMAANTSYALAVSNPAVQTLRWATVESPVSPTAYAGFTFGSYASSSNGGTTWTTSGNAPTFSLLAEATCFLRGTLILTARGEVPVEALKAGDLVATKFGGLRPIRWIGTQSFEGRLAGAGHQPIRFAVASLGGGMPSCALFVSPGHAVLVGDVLAHAGALVNGSTIAQAWVRGVINYFHLDLGPHDCVLANGAWAESYFEDRNRDSFHNAAAFHALNPGHEAERQATCLPIVTAEHPGVDGVRRLLAPRRLRAAA